MVGEDVLMIICGVHSLMTYYIVLRYMRIIISSVEYYFHVFFSSSEVHVIDY